MEWLLQYILWLRIKMYKVSKKVGEDKENKLLIKKELFKDKNPEECTINLVLS